MAENTPNEEVDDLEVDAEDVAGGATLKPVRRAGSGTNAIAPVK